MRFVGVFSAIWYTFLVGQFVLSISLVTFADVPVLTSDSLEIQYLAPEANPLLFSEVKKYIKEQEDSSRLFRDGFGFVTISGLKLIRKGRPIPLDSMSGSRMKDVELTFDVGLSSFYPHQQLGTPLYYSFVSERLVLIYEQQAQWIHGNQYAIKSQQKVKELIRSTLLDELKTDFIFTGIDGSLFKLSPERRKTLTEEQILELGSFTLQKVKTVIRHFDLTISYQYPWIGSIRGVR